jgi:hypothetical protein
MAQNGARGHDCQVSLKRFEKLASTKRVNNRKK